MLPEDLSALEIVTLTHVQESALSDDDDDSRSTDYFCIGFAVQNVELVAGQNQTQNANDETLLLENYSSERTTTHVDKTTHGNHESNTNIITDREVWEENRKTLPVEHAVENDALAKSPIDEDLFTQEKICKGLQPVVLLRRLVRRLFADNELSG